MELPIHRKESSALICFILVSVSKIIFVRSEDGCGVPDGKNWLSEDAKCPKDQKYHCFEDKNAQVVNKGCFPPKYCNLGAHPVVDSGQLICTLCRPGTYQSVDSLLSNQYKYADCKAHFACQASYGKSVCRPGTAQFDTHCTCNSSLGYSPSPVSCDCFTDNDVCQCKFTGCPNGTTFRSEEQICVSDSIHSEHSTTTTDISVSATPAIPVYTQSPLIPVVSTVLAVCVLAVIIGAAICVYKKYKKRKKQKTISRENNSEPTLRTEEEATGFLNLNPSSVTQNGKDSATSITHIYINRAENVHLSGKSKQIHYAPVPVDEERCEDNNDEEFSGMASSQSHGDLANAQQNEPHYPTSTRDASESGTEFLELQAPPPSIGDADLAFSHPLDPQAPPLSMGNEDLTIREPLEPQAPPLSMGNEDLTTREPLEPQAPPLSLGYGDEASTLQSKPLQPMFKVDEDDSSKDVTLHESGDVPMLRHRRENVTPDKDTADEETLVKTRLT